MRLLTDQEQRKRDRGLCVCLNCSNRTEARYCSRCATRVWRARYPLKAMYKALRNNAKRRKKIFTLTWIEFLFFVNQNRHADNRGKTPVSLSIDCDDPRLGYTFTNIRSVTLSYNSAKGNRLYYALVHRGIIQEV